jgi:putative (di)nucleoside polyphosphate hydrolase
MIAPPARCKAVRATRSPAFPSIPAPPGRKNEDYAFAARRNCRKIRGKETAAGGTLSMSQFAYRPCVGIALFNKEGLVFIGRRRSKRAVEAAALGYEWQMPQGGIDLGEIPRAAALRELREETSVSTVSFLAEAPQWLTYDLPPDLSRKAWKGRYRGQTQKWFAFRFEGDDREINIEKPAGGFRPEFDAWRWETIDRLPDLIIPFKRQVYEAVVASFRPLARLPGKSSG